MLNQKMFDDAKKILHQYSTGVTYWPELIDELKKLGHECDGDQAICMEKKPNVILWCGVNAQVVEVCAQLIKSGGVSLWCDTSTIVLLTYPVHLRMPIATKARIKSGKRDCWLPSGLQTKEQMGTNHPAKLAAHTDG